MRKYTVLAAALVIHLCLGGIYAWSVFVPELNRAFEYTSAQTQLVFGIVVAVLAFGSVFGGRMQDLWGPRLPACLSGILLGLGYLVAGSVGDRFWGLVVGISLLCGMGVAFGYVASIAAVAKWFPSARGLVTGIVVSGYGCAAILLSAGAEYLLSHGWPVLRVFRLVGLVYGPIVLVAGLTLSVPAVAAAGAAAREFCRTSLRKDRRFWRLAIGMACGTYPGLALIGVLKPIGTWHGFDLLTATLSISALAVGNGVGRIFWGLIHDRMRGRDTVLLLLSAVVVSVLVFAAGGSNGILFLASAFLLGFCYGGSLVIFPTEVAVTYGVGVMGSVYPFVLFAHGIAALVAAPLTGYGVDITGGYWPGVILALGVAVVGVAACALLSGRKNGDVQGSR